MTIMLHPAALAFVPFGIVLVRVRVPMMPKVTLDHSVHGYVHSRGKRCTGVEHSLPSGLLSTSVGSHFVLFTFYFYRATLVKNELVRNSTVENVVFYFLLFTTTADAPKSVQKKWIHAAFCNRGQSRQQLAQLKARNIKTSNPEKNRVRSQSHRVTANRSTKKKVSNPSTPGKKTKNLFSQWYKGFTELWRGLSNPLSIAHSSSSWLWTAVSE